MSDLLSQLGGGFLEIWVEWVPAATWQIALFVSIIGLLNWALRDFSARLRHGLWLLVLLKIFLPPSLATWWSVGNLFFPAQSLLVSEATVDQSTNGAEMQGSKTTEAEHELTMVELGVGRQSLPAVLAAAWLVGCLGFWGLVCWRYCRLLWSLKPENRIDEGPIRVLFEQVALALSLKRVPDLYQTDRFTSPFLIGAFHPRVVLPASIVDGLPAESIRTVLQHELVHFKNRDVWVGWLQVIAQGLFWFHPFVWWANRQLRDARESACDEKVLQLEDCSPDDYSESIFRVLTATQGRSLAAHSLAGVFERGANLQQRLEEIMSFDQSKRRFTLLSRVSILIVAVAFLPMSPMATSPASARNESEAEKQQQEQPPKRYPGPRPVIVSTVPEIGAKDVDPKLDSIQVTFDRKMSKGYSWTGSPKFYQPPSPQGSGAYWKDDWTCVYPVELQSGEYYRVGINSTSFENFQSVDGEPAWHRVIYFTTKGAKRGIERRLRVPEIVEIEPENGATDVDPRTRAIRVTFNMPMGGGMSWVGGGPAFPEGIEGRKIRWSKNGRTCIKPVTLEPGKQYRIGFNSRSFINFQSKWGVPLEPVSYTFTTAAE